MIRDVKGQYGQVSIGMSRPLAKAVGGKAKTPFSWFVWPEGINSMEAILADALYGPFDSEDAAKEAAEKGFQMEVDP